MNIWDSTTVDKYRRTLIVMITDSYYILHTFHKQNKIVLSYAQYKDHGAPVVLG